MGKVERKKQRSLKPEAQVQSPETLVVGGGGF